MAIEAGKFDNVPAIVYKKVTTYTDREPVQSSSQHCQTYIRFPYIARMGYETQAQAQTHSVGQVVIRTRRNEKTKSIDPSMEFYHRGKYYGIVSINPLEEEDELEFLLQYRNISQVVTE